MGDNADKKAYLRVFLKYVFIYGRSHHQRLSTVYKTSVDNCYIVHLRTVIEKALYNKA